jgi:NADH:ubiquinone oxidoreductase subunit E
MALQSAARYANYFRTSISPSVATVVYCDSVSVIYMSANPVLHHLTKHIEIDIHIVQEKVALSQV